MLSTKSLNNHWEKYQFLKLNQWKVNDKSKVVHRNLLLPLFTYPSDHTNELDTKSMVDQTVSTIKVIVVSATANHVQNMVDYSRAGVTNMFQRGLEFVTALFE